MFADDTSLYIIVEHPNTAAAHLQSDISRISVSADTWFVSFNQAKSESQLFTRKTNGPIHPPPPPHRSQCSVKRFRKSVHIDLLGSSFHVIALGTTIFNPSPIKLEPEPT